MPPQNLQRLRYDVDYYAILDVPEDATEDEIRRSYKKLALEAHPDKTPERRAWAEKRIRELIEAYEVLSQPASRELVDRYRRASGTKHVPAEPFFFHRKTPGARALLILHYLLNGRAADALELLVEQEEEFGDGYLEEYLCREDYLDSLFLLAEHHLERNDLLAAAQRLRTFYHHDCQSRQRRHYHAEVVRQLKSLYLRRIPRRVEPALRVAYLSEAVEFKLTPKEETARLQQLAAAYIDTGRALDAEGCIERLRARGIDGVDALAERLADLKANSPLAASNGRRRRKPLRPQRTRAEE